MNRTVLYSIIGVLAVAAGVFSFQLYQERQKTGGIEISVGKSGISSEDVDDEYWLWMMNVNVNGVFWCSRAFGRHMIAAGRGEYQPLVANNTTENKSRNRRTRIMILPELDQFFKLMEPKN